MKPNFHFSKKNTLKSSVRRSFLKSTYQASAGLSTLWVLGACGFKLRGSVSIPYKAILISGRPSPSLRYDLERIIATGSNARVVTDAKEADLVLEIISEDSTRQILTYSSTGQISAYRLNNRVVFRAFDLAGAEVVPESDIYVTRDLDFSVSTVLSSDFQQQQFLEAMRNDLALQILRRIATIGRTAK
jgi:LPS-assembly lipoprotein